MITKTLVASCLLLLCYSAQAVGQDVIVYRPFVVEPMAATRVVVQRPPFPQVNVPVVVQRPVVSYRPQTMYSVASGPPPVVAYRAAVETFAPTVYARPIVVRSKVYVPGRPVRNFFRAITP